MKYLFFTIFTASVATLSAFSNESLDQQHDQDAVGILQPTFSNDSPLPQENLESRARCKSRARCRRHSHSSSQVVESLAYGSFYLSIVDLPIVVAPGSFIPFTNVSAANAVFLQNGSILIAQPGDYFVNFGVHLLADETGQVALALNGVVQPGSNIVIVTGEGSGSNSTIVHVPTVPAFLSVVNNGATAITPISGDAGAFIALAQLSGSTD